MLPSVAGLPTLPRFSAHVFRNLRSLLSSTLGATERAIVLLTSTDTLQERDVAPLVTHLKSWCTLISLRAWMSGIGKIRVSVLGNDIKPPTRCPSPKAGVSRHKEDTSLRENRIGFDTVQSCNPCIPIRAFYRLSV